GWRSDRTQCLVAIVQLKIRRMGQRVTEIVLQGRLLVCLKQPYDGIGKDGDRAFVAVDCLDIGHNLAVGTQSPGLGQVPVGNESVLREYVVAESLKVGKSLGDRVGRGIIVGPSDVLDEP